MLFVENILLYTSSYLNYTDSIGKGLCCVNRRSNLIFKHSPKTIKRRIRLQERIIDTYLYHYSNKHNFKWSHEPLPKIYDYLKIPKLVMMNIDDQYVRSIIKAQNRIRNELEKIEAFHQLC